MRSIESSSCPNLWMPIFPDGTITLVRSQILVCNWKNIIEIHYLVHTNVTIFIFIEMCWTYHSYPCYKSMLAGLGTFLVSYLVWVHIIKHYSGEKWNWKFIFFRSDEFKFPSIKATGCTEFSTNSISVLGLHSSLSLCRCRLEFTSLASSSIERYGRIDLITPLMTLKVNTRLSNTTTDKITKVDIWKQSCMFGQKLMTKTAFSADTSQKK